tara:strand:- start:1178 stop:2569 length:1392 start_codon:yes stop_codon:yes gene_type:complete
MPRPDIDLKTIFGAFFSPAALVLLLPGTVVAQEGGEVTFSRDITPILQRSCQQCHNPNGGAPMSLVTYDEVRPYASRMARRTGIRDRMGAMPPWYVEKDIGIQHFKNDPSLSDAEIATVAAWARNGAPEGNPADLPEPLEFPDDIGWKLGEPDLIVSTEEMLVEGTAPDWWGDITPTPTGLTEDRYVKSVEIREVNDVPRAGSERETVGARWVFHHMVWSTRVLDNPRAGASTWPVHEVGRNPDIFDPRAGRILRAGSSIVSSSTHLHSNGRDTRARLEIGFRFHPEDYEPEYRQAIFPFGNGSDIDIRSGEKDQELHAYVVLPQHTKLVTFEPHLHAPGARMCLEAIWGFNIETLSCVGYDHNWVRGYAFEDDYQPILPKGTILHITGFMDNTDDNPNVPDARNWQGSGNRSVANMFIDLGERLFLSDEQFVEEMAQRRERLNLGVNDHVVGCPLCMVIPGS